MTGTAQYLLKKRDLYYRPNNCGYTGIKAEAGRYLKSDEQPECGVVAIHEDEAPDYSSPIYMKDAHIFAQFSEIEALKAENARLRAEREWRPIETAPGDTLHIRGLWVRNSRTGDFRWNNHLGYIDDETEHFIDENGDDFGWSAEDYTHWMPLPEPPLRSGGPER